MLLLTDTTWNPLSYSWLALEHPYYEMVVHPSVHNDRVALGYMGHWAWFVQEVMTMFHSTQITHQVPINNESEKYAVGSELGLSGRFIRNICDPAIQALMPLPEMSSVRFADIQALTFSSRVMSRSGVILWMIDRRVEQRYSAASRFLRDMRLVSIKKDSCECLPSCKGCSRWSRTEYTNLVSTSAVGAR